MLMGLNCPPAGRGSDHEWVGVRGGGGGRYVGVGVRSRTSQEGHWSTGAMNAGQGLPHSPSSLDGSAPFLDHLAPTSKQTKQKFHGFL